MNIGIDLGGTNIAAAIVDSDHKIVVKDSVPTGSERGFEAVVLDMGTLCRDLTKRTGLSLSDIHSIGVGSPGTPDAAGGRILHAGNLHWDNVPLRDELKKYVGPLSIRLENDANCAALGEALAGAGRQYRSFVMVTLGTGVGGGVILDGQILSGATGAGGEVGHMVTQSGGEPCTCGRRGCWERYASATGLVRIGEEAADRNPHSLLAAKRKEEGLNGRNIFDVAEEGDATAQEVLKTYTWHVAEGIVNLVNIFAPEAIIVGGGVAGSGEALLAPVRAQMEQDGFCSRYSKGPVLIKAELGNDAGLIGAAALGDR